MIRALDVSTDRTGAGLRAARAATFDGADDPVVAAAGDAFVRAAALADNGAPKLNVLLSEVGLAESQIARVGGATQTPSTRDPWQGWLIAA
jgi:hypothetical protein